MKREMDGSGDDGYLPRPNSAQQESAEKEKVKLGNKGKSLTSAEYENTEL